MLRIIPSVIFALRKGLLVERVTVNICYSTLCGEVRIRSYPKADKNQKEVSRPLFLTDPFLTSIQIKGSSSD
jgi:hypothetical protein